MSFKNQLHEFHKFWQGDYAIYFQIFSAREVNYSCYPSLVNMKMEIALNGVTMMGGSHTSSFSFQRLSSPTSWLLKLPSRRAAPIIFKTLWQTYSAVRSNRCLSFVSSELSRLNILET
jgi:hypothetical protein